MNRDNEVGETKDLKFARFRLLDAFRIRERFAENKASSFSLDENIRRYFLLFIDIWLDRIDFWKPFNFLEGRLFDWRLVRRMDWEGYDITKVKIFKKETFN